MAPEIYIARVLGGFGGLKYLWNDMVTFLSLQERTGVSSFSPYLGIEGRVKSVIMRSKSEGFLGKRFFANTQNDRKYLLTYSF